MRSHLGIAASVVVMTLASISGVAVAMEASTAQRQITADREVAPQGQGQVLGARAAPRVLGRATYATSIIRVGQQTSLRVTLRNRGNGESGTGLACIRLSSAVVVVRVPAGMTNQGSVLCLKRGVLRPGEIRVLTKDIVIRGVRPTSNAIVRDGRDDGVAITGDRLQVLGVLARSGGVTG